MEGYSTPKTEPKTTPPRGTDNSIRYSEDMHSINSTLIDFRLQIGYDLQKIENIHINLNKDLIHKFELHSTKNEGKFDLINNNIHQHKEQLTDIKKFHEKIQKYFWIASGVVLVGTFLIPVAFPGIFVKLNLMILNFAK